MFCAHCGKQVETSYKFCGHCGHTLNSKQAVNAHEQSGALAKEPLSRKASVYESAKSRGLTRVILAVAVFLAAVIILLPIDESGEGVIGVLPSPASSDEDKLVGVWMPADYSNYEGPSRFCLAPDGEGYLQEWTVQDWWVDGGALSIATGSTVRSYSYDINNGTLYLDGFEYEKQISSRDNNAVASVTYTGETDSEAFGSWRKANGGSGPGFVTLNSDGSASYHNGMTKERAWWVNDGFLFILSSSSTDVYSYEVKDGKLYLDGTEYVWR